MEQKDTFEQAINLAYDKLSTFYSLLDYEPSAHISFQNIHTDQKYAILLTDEPTLTQQKHLQASEFERKGYVVCILPIMQNYLDQKVANETRYQNYQHRYDDFGGDISPTLYRSVPQILEELSFPVQENKKITNAINEQGNLELLTIEEGEDVDGPRTDLFEIKNNYSNELEQNKWSFYTPKNSSESRAILGPANSDHLANYFTEHNQF